ncbi:MAG TPA: hypothetical protein VM802_03575 [Chitinophaga sp.]|uniref:hypothetical protein n=1 Tax=Chitinophaga sp. TaxID=1869181 RepID=UPI002C8B8955|nr:hypothetical protein [Chitinophaga sp.]HVI43914.1 hypothetical protein [Chitinophaga sp.]
MDYIENFLELIHRDATFTVYWLFYLGYIFLSLWLGRNDQLNGKKISGWLQTAGGVALVIGLFFPPMTLIPFLWLLPLAVVNLLKAPAAQRYNLLYCAVMPVLLAIMNRTYGII